MVVRKEDLHNLIEHLKAADQKTVYDFMQYLIQRSEKKRMSWDDINAADSDDVPLNEEEVQQLGSDEEYVSLEKAKHELGL